MRELSRAQSVLDRYDIPSSVVYMDLDSFKAVNDEYGHCVGDDMLKTVGAAIQAEIRECDMVARLGGDEFGVLLFKTHPKIAEAKAAALAKRIAALEISTETGVIPTNVSWGVATCNMRDSAEHVLAKADRKMYKAKRGARGSEA